MTTRVELQRWLDQFPEDAQIEVITTAENDRYGYQPYTSVYETEMKLEVPADYISYFQGETFEIEKFGDRFVIRLGKKGD